jgi:small subunit ribosomal protein S3
MGKKINPKIIRMGITRTWHSAWFSSGNDYIKNVKQDVSIRRYILKEFREAGVDKVEISRGSGKVSIDIYTAKPGVIIGRGGNGVEELKKNIHRKFLSNPMKIRVGDINVNIKQVDNPALSAQINVQSMALEIEKRVPFRKVMKQTVSRIERAGAMGVKVVVAGRLNGAEIARSEKLTSGKLPLSTLRANIDYARGSASTTYGAIGIKVWIYKGEVFKETENK